MGWGEQVEGKQENLNEARMHRSADTWLCLEAGDFCLGCIVDGLSMATQGICIRQMGVPSISDWSVPDSVLENQVP